MSLYQNWFLASRPWSFTMTAISVSVGAALGAMAGDFSWPFYLVTLVGMIVLHAATNLMNDYYDVSLKESRIKELENGKGSENFRFFKVSLENYDALKIIFDENHITRVCHLAAQAGVRYSVSNPFSFMQSNGVGFLNILELSKDCKAENFVYASYSVLEFTSGSHIR